MADIDPHRIVEIEERIARLKLKARGAASINDYKTANELETQIADLLGELNDLQEEQTDMKDMKPGEFEELGKLIVKFLSEEEKEPEHKGTKDCACHDCMGTKDAGESYTVEYREGMRSKRSTFNNRQRAIDFFHSVQSDPDCIDAELHDDRTNRVIMHDKKPTKDAAPAKRVISVHIHR